MSTRGQNVEIPLFGTVDRAIGYSLDLGQFPKPGTTGVTKDGFSRYTTDNMLTLTCKCAEAADLNKLTSKCKCK